jgi:hypothetical protein
MNKHIEAAAKAYYDIFPNGYSKWEYISTATDAERQKVFYPDPWEEAPDRHKRCAKTALFMVKAFIDSFEDISTIKEILKQTEQELKDVFPYGGPEPRD